MNDHSLPHDTRTLRRLELPARMAEARGAKLRRALYVDCETTGFSVERDEVIELAMLPFVYDPPEGRVVEVLHDEALVCHNDPGRPLDPAVAALTGLTDEDLDGRHIDVEAASALVARTHLIVAHNARFDRPFFERVLPPIRAVPWACSMRDVPWTEHRCPSTALHCLACQYGVFARDRHRALADCEVGVWLLAQALPDTDRPVLAALLEHARRETVRLWAARAPFHTKDALRARGYRWMPRASGGIDRAWWTELAPELVGAELEWLRENVYAGRLPHLPQRRAGALDRWREDPADTACRKAAA